MKNKKLNAALIIFAFLMLAGCNFIGGVFKTGIGVGVFLVVALLVIILLISRAGRRNDIS